MITIIIAAIVIAGAIRLVYELRGLTAYTNSLSPEEKAIHADIIASRKNFIMKDGAKKHLEWQGRHPLLAKLYKYQPKKYYRDNQLNYRRYPF